MTPPTPPRFDVSVVHHRLPRGVLESADRGLPLGFEPAIRGAFHLADTLELRPVDAPAGEAPIRVHRLRVNAMTHAGDLLQGGWAMSITAGPAGLDTLRSWFGPLARHAGVARPAKGHGEGAAAAAPGQSLYPLASEAAAAATPWLPWLLPSGHGQVRRLRFERPAGASVVAETSGLVADRFWVRLADSAGVAAESRLSLRGVALRWSTEASRPLLVAPPRRRATRHVAAVA